MKKIILSLAFLIAGTTAFSQVTFKPGVRVGVNFSSIEKIEADSKTGFYAGALGEIHFGGIYALQPEIAFSQQGAKDIDLDYLTITIVNKIYPLKEETPIFLSIGPSFDFNLHGQTETYSTSTGTGVNFDADFSFIGGIGYSLPMGIDVEVRYKKGLLDVFNDGSLNGRTNSVIQIGAAYKFDF